MKKFSVLIPTYNEKDNLEKLIPKLLAFKTLGEILVIDDGSRDGTKELVEKYSLIDSRVKLLERGLKLGIGSAYKEGFTRASFEHIITMDADLSHDPADLEKFFEDADLVVGSRHLKGSRIIGWSLTRYIIHITANLLVRLFLGINLTDMTSGYRLYKKDAIKNIIKYIRSNGFAFQIEILFYLYKAKYKIKEVPIIFVTRRKGESKFNLNEIIDFLKTLLFLLPYRFK